MDFRLTEDQEMLRPDTMMVMLAKGGGMKVRDLTVEEFKALIQDALEEKLDEVFGDPDRGLELREDVRKRLEESLATIRRGERGIPVEKVAKELGLE